LTRSSELFMQLPWRTEIVEPDLAHVWDAAVLLRHLIWLGKLLTGGDLQLSANAVFLMADGCYRSGAWAATTLPEVI
jgi:hypothetical protein